MRIFSTTLLSLFFCGQAMAIDSGHSTLFPTEDIAKLGILGDSTIQVSGSLDAYYQHNFIGTPFPTTFTETNNSFSPGMANLIFSKEGKYGFVADFSVGTRAEAVNGHNGTTLALIKQLYITYAPNEKVNFLLGNFSTYIGYEGISPTSNANYSTSYMFTNGPFFHTGMKAEFALTESFGAMVGVFNDTNTKIDAVSGKHLGSQLSYNKNGWSANLNFITGKDDDSRPEDEINGTQFDLTASYEVNEKWLLGVNATTLFSKGEISATRGWDAAAIYSKHAVSDRFDLGFRGEFINDKDGMITGEADNTITSLTLSGNIHLGPITVIPEYRINHASKDTFTNDDGGPEANSHAFIFAVIYKF